MKILAISGSLRKDSYNTSLLRVAQSVAPQGVEIELADIGALPLFNQDIEANFPEAVAAFKKKIEASDAVLFAIPEYNYSFSGVLKNALDWASRPYGKNSFGGKPAAIMSAAYTMGGGARAQYHFRQVAVYLDLKLINQPEFMLPAPHEQFDEGGNLKDAALKSRVQAVVEALVAWTKKLS